MSTDEINYEVSRFKKVTEIFDYLSREVEKITDDQLRRDIYTNICELEDLIYKSPEWETRGFSDAVNLTLFGSKDSGKRNLLKRLLPYDTEKYSLDSAIRFKHIITLKDQSPQLLMIRYDGDFLPFQSACDWTDCAMFMFNVSDEESFKQAMVSHVHFQKLSKSGHEVIPAILVGLLIPSQSSQSNEPIVERLFSYSDLFEVARKHNFHTYIEARPDTMQNVDFLFKYAIAIATKNKTSHRNMNTSINEDLPEDNKENTLDQSFTSKRRSFVSVFKFPQVPKKPRMSMKNSNLKLFSNSTSNQKKSLRSNSICKSLHNSSNCGSSLSISTEASDENEEDANKADWHLDGVLKQGVVAKVGSVMSDNIFLTITTNGKMLYHKSEKHYNDGKKPKFINLTKFLVRVPGNNLINGFNIRVDRSDNRNSRKKSIDDRTFEMDGCSEDQSRVRIVFRVEDQEERNAWVNTIKDSIFANINRVPIEHQNPAVLSSLSAIQKLSCNERCAECDTPNPTWMNYGLGIFICERCAGAHRASGKVLSTALNVIDELHVRIMSMLGNAIVNSVFEATLHLTDVHKPEPGKGDVSEWLRMKYIDKRFLAPLSTDQKVSRQLMVAITEQDYRQQLICIHNGTHDQLDDSFGIEDERNGLLIAAQSGLPVSVQLLIWAGVDCHVRDSNQINAFGYASYTESHDHDMVLAILRQYGVAQQVLNSSVTLVTENREELATGCEEGLSLVTKRRRIILRLNLENQ